MVNVPSYFVASYVTLSFLNREDQVLNKVKTKTQRGTISPEFGDKMSIDMSEQVLAEVKVKIKLKASRLLKMGKNPVIGEGMILPDSDHWKRLLENGDCKGWFHVFRQSK